MKGTKQYVVWLYMAGCSAYVGYEWYCYTGLYRLAAEWQMRTFGSYSMKLTLLLPLLVVLIPGLVVARCSVLRSTHAGRWQSGHPRVSRWCSAWC